MKNSRGRGFLCLLIAVAAIAVFGYFGYVSAGDVKLGLDLAGGVSITYQAVGDATDEQMDDTVYKLRKRVDTYSTEADVYREGSDRINIDIPGVTDANAILETLGQPGSLRFTDMDGNTILTGDQVASAKAGVTDSNGSKEYLVSLTFNEEGTKAFADATSSRIGQQIAIVYDGAVGAFQRVVQLHRGGVGAYRLGAEGVAAQQAVPPAGGGFQRIALRGKRRCRLVHGSAADTQLLRQLLAGNICALGGAERL